MLNESNQIHVIGVDTSRTECFFEAKKESILKAERIAGPKRILELFKIWLNEKNIATQKFEFICTDKLSNFIDLLKKEEKKTIVFSGGDPLWFGIGRLLIQNFPLSKLCLSQLLPLSNLLFPDLANLGKIQNGSVFMEETRFNLKKQSKSFLLLL